MSIEFRMSLSRLGFLCIFAVKLLIDKASRKILSIWVVVPMKSIYDLYMMRDTKGSEQVPQRTSAGLLDTLRLREKELAAQASR